MVSRKSTASDSRWLSEWRHGCGAHGERNRFVSEVRGKDLEFFCEGRIDRAKMEKVCMVEGSKLALELWKESNGEAKVDGGGRGWRKSNGGG